MTSCGLNICAPPLIPMSESECPVRRCQKGRPLGGEEVMRVKPPRVEWRFPPEERPHRAPCLFHHVRTVCEPRRGPSLDHSWAEALILNFLAFGAVRSKSPSLICYSVCGILLSQPEQTKTRPKHLNRRAEVKRINWVTMWPNMLEI